MTARGLPHSEISGSSPDSGYSELIAAYYVLHRLWCQGIHLCALSYFFALREIFALLRELEIAVNLALDSSSLCSFQGAACLPPLPPALERLRVDRRGVGPP